MASAISMANQTAWGSKWAAFSYRHAATLFPAEQAVLRALGPELARARVLDIGIGTGRTTGHLASQCASYLGVDYAPAMIERARARFPRMRLQVLDARDMHALGAANFDLVFFSYNGIDYVDHHDRLTILGEIQRVLRPGGAFAFSAHRFGVAIPPASAVTNLQFGLHPARNLRNAVRYVRGIRHAARLKPREQITSDYALLNDSAQQYQLLTYYITPQQQARQLDGAGFNLDQAFAQSGATIVVDAPYPAAHARDYMVHYLARRR